MLSEVRYLTFERADVEDILRHGARKAKRHLPPGRLTCFRAELHEFEFRFDRSQLFSLTPPECFSFILWYCQSNKIPIARRLKKRLEVYSNHLILVLGDIDAAASSRRVFAKLRADTRCRVCEAEGSPCRFELGNGVETPAVPDPAR